MQRLQCSGAAGGEEGLAPHPAASASIGLQTDPGPASRGSTAAATAAAIATDRRDAATATDAPAGGSLAAASPAETQPAVGKALQQAPTQQPSVGSTQADTSYGWCSSAAQLYPGGEGIAVQPLAGGGGIAVQPLGGRLGVHPGAAANQPDLRHLLTLSDDEDYLAMPLAFASDSGSDSDAGGWAGCTAAGGAVSSGGQAWGGGSGSNDGLSHADLGTSNRQPAER